MMVTKVDYIVTEYGLLEANRINPVLLTAVMEYTSPLPYWQVFEKWRRAVRYELAMDALTQQAFDRYDSDGAG